MKKDQTQESHGLQLVGLGFVAVIALAGLVLLLTQTSAITGEVSGMQNLGGRGILVRTPYEACRAVRVGDGLMPVWTDTVRTDMRANKVQNPRRIEASTITQPTLYECTSPKYPNRIYYVEPLLKYG